MRDLSELTRYLGVEVEQSKYEIFIHKTKYCNDVLTSTGLAHAHASRIPMEVNARFTSRDDKTDGNEPSHLTIALLSGT